MFFELTSKKITRTQAAPGIFVNRDGRIKLLQLLYQIQLAGRNSSRQLSRFMKQGLAFNRPVKILRILMQGSRVIDIISVPALF